MDEMQAAEALWDYHQLGHKPRRTDVAIGLGSHDIGVAEHAADLYHQDMFPLIVFTGASAPTTTEVFPRGEAVHYAERAEQLGVPPTAILRETTATNTAENFTRTRDLLTTHGITPTTATIICRPYQQRRAYATCRKVWPELDVTCSSRRQTLTDYMASIGDREKVLSMIVGDMQRIWLYAERGYAIPQPVPDEALHAYQTLTRAGYTTRLLG